MADPIRPVTLADIPSMQACVSADTRRDVPGIVATILERDDTAGFVWDGPDGVVGWAWVGWSPPAERTPEGWWCRYTVVKPDHQKSGISAKLMEARLEWLLDRGAETVYASYPWWSPGPAFRWGFIPVPSTTWTMNGVSGERARWVLWEASPPIL